MSNDVPTTVQELADSARTATGIEPVIEQTGDRRWRVTVATDRVVATADFKRSSAGRVYWDGGTLHVDGQERPTAKTMEQLAGIIADPDGRAVQVEPMPPSRAVRGAPPVVQQAYWMLARRLGSDAVQLGANPDRWVIGLQKPTATLRVRYVKHGQRWGLDHGSPIQLIVDGVDRSDEVAADIAAALALLMGKSTEAEGTSAAAGPAAAEGYGSVGVRRHSVIRT